MPKRKNTKKFVEYERDSNTASYPPPQQVVKPAPGDKGYGLVNSEFKKQKPYFRPGIKSVNKDLKENEF